MALTKAQQKSWDKNKKYWLNRWLEQDLKNETDYKIIQAKYKELLEKVNKQIQKEICYMYSTDLSPSEIKHLSETWIVIDNMLNDMANNETQILNESLQEKYKDVYKENLELLLENNFHMINEGVVQEAVKTNWSGLEFSERIWKNRQELGYSIKEEFQKGLIRGDSLQDMSNNLSNLLNSSYKNMMRLVRTETCAIQSKATLDSFTDSGVVKKFEFSAFLDSRTSPQCREMDGKIIKITKGMIGENIPPLHPNCRSCILPVITKTYYSKDNKLKQINKNNPTDNKIIKDNIKANKKDNIKAKEEKTIKKEQTKKVYITYSKSSDLKRSDTTKAGKQFVKDIPSNEYKALRYYTGSAYTSINNQLRRGQDNGEEKTIELISKALKKFPAKEDIMLHRGTSKRALKGLFATEDEFNEAYNKCRTGGADKDFLNEKFVGGVMIDEGFMSTSALTTGAFGKDIGMHIKIDKDSNYGAYINELSHFKDSEFEYLLDKNLAMEIYEAEVKNNGRLELYLRIIGYANK